MKKGFQLIQLLVAVTIIALITVVVIASTSSIRSKTRDKKRIADFTQMKVALEFYREAEGHYPYSCNTTISQWSIGSFDSVVYEPRQLCSDLIIGTGGSTQIGTLTTVMAPYISKLKDPKNLGGDSAYLYYNIAGANSYCFHAWKTPEDLRNYPPSMINPTRCGGFNASNGQCNVNGSDTQPFQMDVFIGKGSYLTAGC